MAAICSFPLFSSDTPEAEESFSESPEKIIEETLQPLPIYEENNLENIEEQNFLTPLIETHKERPEVEKWRQYYLSSDKRLSLLRDILEYGMEYRLYVRKIVNDRELPSELEYVPVVESNYRTNAKSRSGALGMWQFMENSVKPFLTLTEYVDERLDPWKSTEAGLSKLEDNYSFFNDWLLAVGAYNCGAGAMQKAISKGQSSDFWYLSENGYIPSQTKEYVPRIIAIADLAINHEEYDIDLPLHQEEYELLDNERDGHFDYITVNKAYSISALASELRMDDKKLKTLNPALTKGFTPPAAKYNIRLPLGMKSSAETALASIEPIVFPFQYKVVPGDSLWSISRKFGVTVKALCDTNGIEEKAILKIGKILYIPQK
ncbi:MAG: transglycosylase SLT domain-containing protein [Treponema sp.]|nr:transglycosylase SLT domain-containing protein [Treponema sp.]